MYPPTFIPPSPLSKNMASYWYLVLMTTFFLNAFIFHTRHACSTGIPPLDDECINYKSLNEANRIESFNYGRDDPKCDRDINGWYRFEGAAGSQMAESCPPQYHCGTEAPGWLNGKHPTVAEKIVGRDACFSWTASCCQWIQRVFVRNCGEFYVYQLAPPPLCNMRYCGSNKLIGQYITQTAL